jgi:hypothetical protein
MINDGECRERLWTGRIIRLRKGLVGEALCGYNIEKIRLDQLCPSWDDVVTLVSQRLEFDPVGMKVINNGEADALLSPEYRQGWSL